MVTYVTEFPTKGKPKYSFTKTGQILNKNLNKLNPIYHVNHIINYMPCIRFLSQIALTVLPDDLKQETKLDITGIYEQTYFELTHNNPKTWLNKGFCIIPTAEWKNAIKQVEKILKTTNKPYQELTVAEKTLATEKQALKIYALDYSLIVISNCTPDLKTTLNLLALQNALVGTIFKTKSNHYTKLLGAIIEKDLKTFNQVLKDFDNYYDFKINNIKQVIKSIQEIDSTEKNELKNKQKQYEKLATNKIEELKQISRTIKDLQKKITFFDLNNNFDEELHIKYLKQHPYIIDTKQISDEELLFEFEAPLIYYNIDIVNDIKFNFTRQNRILLELIIHDNYDLYTNAKLILNLRTKSISNDNTVEKESEKIRHPHISEFNCFGNHLNEIKKWIVNDDYIGTLEAMSTAVLNLNFYDSVVIRRLLENLQDNRTNKKTWYAKDIDEFLTLEQVLEKEKIKWDE